MQEAYIVAGYRTAVTKSKRGGFRFTRPDDLAVEVIKGLMASIPNLEASRVDDVIVGNAVPEAEQGLQVGRIIAARALGFEVPGMTVNRYCASGLETIAIATAKIRMGMADCIVAGGTESMTMVPTAGWKTVPAYSIASDEPDYYLNMGLTAEAVAKEYNVSREDQDAFSFNSHQKAINAIQSGYFKEGILPINVEQVYLDEAGKKKTRKLIVKVLISLLADVYTVKEMTREIYKPNKNIVDEVDSEVIQKIASELLPNFKFVQAELLEQIPISEISCNSKMLGDSNLFDCFFNDNEW